MDVTIGSRKSKLALWQTEFVAAMLQKNGISTLIKSMETIGDKVLDTSIAKIGSKGVFTEELEEQLRSGETDIDGLDAAGNRVPVMRKGEWA